MAGLQIIHTGKMKHKIGFFILLFAFTCCAQSEHKVHNFVLPSDVSTMASYTMGLDGGHFYYINPGGWLVSMNVETLALDSVFLFDCHDRFVQVLAHATGIAVLSFDKNTQYEENSIKKVDFLRCSVDMNVLDTLSFEVPRPSRLLCEDFNFVNCFFDTISSCIYLNDTYSRLYVIKNNTWSFEGFEKTVVDPLTGKCYQLTRLKNHEEGNLNNCTVINHEMVSNRVTQFSVFNDLLVYAESNCINIFQLNALNVTNEIVCEHFNPCRRYNNGLYRLLENQLQVFKLVMRDK